MPRKSSADVRNALLLAGRRLSETQDMSNITGRSVAAEAGLKATQFSAQFASRGEFLCELLRLMLDEVRDSVPKLLANMGPGVPRMKLAFDTYLAGNLSRPQLRALALELRDHPQGSELLRKRALAFMMFMEMELKSAQWPRPAATARLLTAGLQETLAAEFEAGRVQKDLREAIYTYLDSRS